MTIKESNSTIDEVENYDVDVQKLYSIFDIKTRLWSTVQCHESKDALWQFLNVIVNTHGAGDVHTHSEDFVVYELGSFDITEGIVSLLDPKQVVTSLSALKKPCPICDKEAEQAAKVLKDVQD